MQLHSAGNLAVFVVVVWLLVVAVLVVLFALVSVTPLVTVSPLQLLLCNCRLCSSARISCNSTCSYTCNSLVTVALLAVAYKAMIR